MMVSWRALLLHNMQITEVRNKKRIKAIAFHHSKLGPLVIKMRKSYLKLHRG